MKKLCFLTCLAALLVACAARPTAEEQAIRSMCGDMVQHYPEATLQDIYKTCFQDFFGAEHLLRDTAAAYLYLKAEIEANRNQELNAMPMYEPTGFRHRFVRVNIAEVLSGDMSEEELFALFSEAAGTSNALPGQWEEEWLRIEQIAVEVHPAWTDTALQAELHYAASIAAPVRHSEPFRKVYNPHYRIIKNTRGRWPEY